MKLFEDEIKMIEFFRSMKLFPSEIVSFMSIAGKDCLFCPIHDKCSNIFGSTKQGGAECQSILKYWIEDIPFNLPVPESIDVALKSLGFEKTKQKGVRCIYGRAIESCHISLTPHIGGWTVKLTDWVFDEIYCDAADLNKLMLVLEKRIKKQIDETKKLAEEESDTIPFDTIMRMINFAREIKNAFETIKTEFKEAGLTK